MTIGKETSTGEDKLEIIRHSASHIMAEAVQAIFGDVKFGIGKGIHRTGIDTNPAFTAFFVFYRAFYQRCISEYGGEADPGAELAGQQQTVLSNPSQTG